ncbi:MAG: hypothetical protein J6U74_01395, partial [Clostridia bacterium]|nr:hypothetical protein [Clostridia bacterium]
TAIGWTFTTDTTKETNGKDGFYFIDTTGKSLVVKPMDKDGITNYDWEDIISHDFTGFYVKNIEVDNGRYFSLMTGDTFATPSHVDTVGNESTGKVTINYVGYNGSTNFVGDIVASIGTLKEGRYGESSNIETHFDGTDKAPSTVETYLNGALISSASDYAVSQALVTEGADTVNVTGHEIKYLATATAGGKVFGMKLFTITINPLSLADDGNDTVKVFYVGDVYGLTNKKITVNGVETDAYDVTNGGIIRYADNISGTYYVAVIPEGQSTYTALYSIAYGATTGTSHPSTLNGAVTATHNSTYNNSTKFGYDSTSEFTGTGNYTGSRTITYTILGSDFGKNAGATGAWGSSTNPYVISHWSHLVRLSEIVNKVNDPLDSVAGKGTQPTNVQASNIFFTGGCYFEVQGTIELPEGIDFKPIGGHDISKNTEATAFQEIYSYFAGNIYGSNGDAAAEIVLGNALSEYDQDYSGLFGLVIGTEAMPATITNLHVSATTISGNRYVGSLVGRAEEYVIIDNTNSTNTYKINANVTGTKFVGGLVGYVGVGTEIYGRYDNNGTITASGDYIGGFIGQLMAGAGKEDKTLINPTFYLGNVDGKILAFENQGIVSMLDGSTASYVGGIIGGTVANTG